MAIIKRNRWLLTLRLSELNHPSRKYSLSRIGRERWRLSARGGLEAHEIARREESFGLDEMQVQLPFESRVACELRPIIATQMHLHAGTFITMPMLLEFVVGATHAGNAQCDFANQSFSLRRFRLTFRDR